MYVALVLVTVLLLVVSAFDYVSHRNKRRRLAPRGPLLRLPFVGHLLSLGSEPQKTLFQWSHKYGPIFRVRLGNFESVVITDAQLIRKAFNSPVLAGRPRIKLIDTIGSDRTDVLSSDGPHVKGHRQFFSDNFKQFAVSSTNSLESRILNEANDVVAALTASSGTPVQMRGYFHSNIINSLLDFITCAKYPKEEKITAKLAQQISSLGETKGFGELLGTYIPEICTIAPKWSGLERRVETVREIQEYFKNIIDKHKETMVTGQPRDILDAYLEKSRESLDPNSMFSSEAGHLFPFFFDILSAGMETTSTQLEWIIYYMAKHPQIQAKLLDEVDSIVGRARRPSLEDRTSLVFTEAVIQESLRLASIFPLGVYHSALDDFELDGYLIPKDTTVISNLYAVHRDPWVWDNPELFRPERFIDTVSGKLTRHHDIVAFGCGKRRCIGEEMARQELFLFLVTIFQHFSVRPVGTLPSEERFGFAVSPSPFKVIFSLRK